MNAMQFLLLTLGCWLAASAVIMPVVWALCKASASQRETDDQLVAKPE